MSDKPKGKKNHGKGKHEKGGDHKKDSKDKAPEKTKDEKTGNVRKPEEKNSEKTNKNVEEPIDTVALFANLKRETDEILKITESKSKYSKREITSNWTKYELPTDNYEIIENQEQGSDFEELLHMPISQGGHFQFKHEKTWSADKKINDFKDLFTLNLSYISSALQCVPYYRRNDIDPQVFPEEQRKRMTSTANKNMNKFKKNLPVEKSESDVTKSLLMKLIDKKDTEVIDNKNERNNDFEGLCEDDAVDNELEEMLVGSLTATSIQTNDNKDENKKYSTNQNESDSMYDFTTNDLVFNSKDSDEGLVFSKVPIVADKSPTKTKHKGIDDDDELDEILGISSSSAVVTGTIHSNIAPNPVIFNEPKSVSPKPAEETKMDLDKWLDDYLDS